MGWELFDHGPAPPSWDGAAWPRVTWEPRRGLASPAGTCTPHPVFPHGAAATPRLTPRRGGPHTCSQQPPPSHHRSGVPCGGPRRSTPFPAHTPAREHGPGGPRDGAPPTERTTWNPMYGAASHSPDPSPPGMTDSSLQQSVCERGAKAAGRMAAREATVSAGTAARGHAGTCTLASARSPAAAPLCLGFHLCVGSTAFARAAGNRLRPRARADQWPVPWVRSAGRSLA